MVEGILSPAPLAAAPSRPDTPVDLRPLSTSELLDRGFVLYRAHFAGFLLLALLGQAAPLLSQIFITAGKLNPSQNDIWLSPLDSLAKLGLVMVVGILAQFLVFGFEVVVTFYIADAYLGKIPSVSDSLRRFASVMVSALWTCFLARLLVGLTFILPISTIAGAIVYYRIYPPEGFGDILVFGSVVLACLIAAMTPVLVVFMRLMLTVPAFALEGLTGWKAVVRSSELVRYDPGLGFFQWGEMRLSFLLLPLFVIELLILSLTYLPVMLFDFSEILRHGSISEISAPPDATIIVSHILTYFAGSLIWPLYAIAPTLFYYDVRSRREGFDLEWMARQLGAEK